MFAAAALRGAIASDPDDTIPIDQLATYSWDVAEAMITEYDARRRKKEERFVAAMRAPERVAAPVPFRDPMREGCARCGAARGYHRCNGTSLCPAHAGRMDWVADTGFIGSGAYLTEDEYDDMGAHWSTSSATGCTATSSSGSAATVAASRSPARAGSA
jgi:hypothetical protein